MRILIDMTEEQIKSLDSLAEREGRSRASLIRAAVDEYLQSQHRHQVGDGFGLWGTRRVDGLAYQKKLRNEW